MSPHIVRVLSRLLGRWVRETVVYLPGPSRTVRVPIDRDGSLAHFNEYNSRAGETVNAQPAPVAVAGTVVSAQPAVVAGQVVTNSIPPPGAAPGGRWSTEQYMGIFSWGIGICTCCCLCIMCMRPASTEA